ncbi:pirin family protein [Nocardioides sp.]|uniref:pirin family protein n=1 Tax=Nocardioides sp. TaxID=35761 RepID=UPI003D0F56DD
MNARSSIEILTPREVPLGGLRAMTVRRTLPQRERSFIGGWCFLDHYGPDPVAETGGMMVTPHPHTGLQTVSWLFTGEIDHVDSAGNAATVRPGELNLMTAGRGISHTEVSTAGTTILHGAQLWVALPSASRFIEPGFEHYAPPAITGHRWQARVFLGSLFGSTSPVSTYSALLGVEIVLAPQARLVLPLDASYEHGILLDSGDLVVDDVTVLESELAYADLGATSLTLTSRAGARLLLLGGVPLGEEIVMWWNFVGRSDEEIRSFRAAWQAQLVARESGPELVDGDFGVPAGALPPIPAPELPSVRLKPRR